MATSQLTTTDRGKEQPRLLPYNRKLRNLCSISLRNLLPPAHPYGRLRGKTIDDDADPKTFISPGRLRSLREERPLEHSHSSTDLLHDSGLALEDNDQETAVGNERQDGSPRKPRLNGGSIRARPKRPRRRSTLEWINAGGVQRQEKLERVAEERMANVFFSLHMAGLDDPIYISETVPRTMNPTFRSLDLSRCAHAIQRQNNIILRIWTQSLSSQQWRMLSDTEVSFASLHYLGRSLDNCHYGSEQNTVLFHFSDGIYTAPASISFSEKRPQARNKDNTARKRHTSSFDALLRLAKLTDSIEDALATRNTLANDLERMIQGNKPALDQRDSVFEIEDRLKTIEYAKSTVAKQLDKARRQIEEKRSLLQQRRIVIEADRQAQSQALSNMHVGLAELPHLRDEREIRKKAIAAQRRRIAEDLDKIYCIRPLQGGKSLAFKIRGLPLPNAEELDSVPAATIAAALGYTAHAVQLLSFYLNVTVPYPVNPMGSSSWMTDPISLLNVAQGSSSILSKALSSSTDKAYPLHLTRVARFRFDYAVFLLNKDIQLLLETGFGVRVLDIRHTLPNLKYLLYVATAGEGDLPSRKAGGVRGLMKDAREPLSRHSSASSLTIWSGSPLVKEDNKGNKAANSLRHLVKG